MALITTPMETAAPTTILVQVVREARHIPLQVVRYQRSRSVQDLLALLAIVVWTIYLFMEFLPCLHVFYYNIRISSLATPLPLVLLIYELEVRNGHQSIERT
jgi:presenilin-like A22 family membrane protease